MKDIVQLTQQCEEARESLIMGGWSSINEDATISVNMTADELRLVIKALRYYTYWHDLPEDPNS